MAMTTAATATSTRSLGSRSHSRPVAADTNDHTIVTAANAANKVPPMFARKADGHCPRTKCAQEVVIPQAGHGLSNSITNVHGGKPNC
jgi:hypothetical protein